MLGPW